jgi:hypothetical protein
MPTASPAALCFKDEQLIEFARALLGTPEAPAPEPEPEPFYRDPAVEPILEQFRNSK